MIWSAVTSTRNTLYDKGYLKTYKSTLPVISVGNLTVGGNGKTPLAIYLCKTLSRLGFRPVTLMRGYKGKLKGPVLVTDAHTSFDVGEEAKLIAREANCSVVISRERAAGAKLIEKECIGDLIVLDDGMQHRALQRDIDLVTVFTGSVKSKKEFLQAKVLPFGRFREGRDVGLKRAHAIIFSDRKPSLTEEIDQEIKKLLPESLITFKSQLLPRMVRSINKDQNLLEPQACFAFCGLANPEGFFASMAAFGFEVKLKKQFSDHHNYNKKEVEALRKEAKGLPLVCTTKDAVKLVELGIHDIYELVTDMHVNPEDQFLELLFSKIRN